MSVYAARMKRNLRETIEQRDAILERIAFAREGLVAVSGDDSSMIVQLLDFIATGAPPSDYPDLMKKVH